MKIPQIIYPDQENVVGFRKSGWHMQPKEPHIKGKVVFLTDGRAISYAESCMGFIEHYKLAEIVGQPTAGTNGNVNPYELPGGFRVVWTGMRVVKHDGSQHHLIGIQPTVPVQRTIQGVIEGRDEFVEKALEVIRSD
jgi:C-terminal processing protease CtpA/Prc